MPGPGVRIIDHGIAGALLQLQFLVRFAEIQSALLDKNIPGNKIPRAIHDAFDLDLKKFTPPSWIWQGLVWATAAVAFHNVAQAGKVWLGAEQESDLRISLKEDALTYLGILVDIIQEWDRYSVSRESIFSGKLPVQAKDVEIGTTDKGQIWVIYPNQKVADKVRDALNSSLKNWSRIVKIESK